MKKNLFKCVSILLISLSLAGCPGTLTGVLAQLAPQADTGCKMNYKSAGKFSIAGVEIPITRLPDGQKVKIGSINYEAAEAYELTKGAQALDQARLTSCSVMNNAGFATMSEAYKKDIYDKVIALANRMTDYGNDLASAKDAQQGLNAADKAQTDGKKAAETSKPQQTAEIRMIEDLSDRLSRAMELTSTRTGQLEQKLVMLRSEFDDLQTRGQTSRIDIIGFPAAATNLSAEKRGQLYVRLQNAMAKMPGKQKTLVLIVGYADRSGAYLSNVDLGLRRAQVVKSYIQQQRFPRMFDVRAVSGGVDDSGGGRHVSIYVSAIA